MKSVALVTDEASLPLDYDMPLLKDACRRAAITAEVRSWTDVDTDWSTFDAVLLRSPWTYTERLPDFLAWCERVDGVTQLLNPLPLLRWCLDKTYMADLAARGVPTIPSTFVPPGADARLALREFLASHPEAREIVVKPAVGAYSKDVVRFARTNELEATRHLVRLHGAGCHAMLQPYIDSVDRDGETDLVYFDGVYSHAIHKNPMLLPDGTVNVPTLESRTSRVADEDERAVASAALAAAAAHVGLPGPLLYGRVDVIRDVDGGPMVLEMELAEPSLNLPFTDHGATRFAEALAESLYVKAR
jgi:O-ureido-D-serine cyclo-ligase